MNKEKYNQIRDCLRQLIMGTPFEGKVFFVGGLNGNEVMQIKGIGPGEQVRECLEFPQKLAFVNSKMNNEEVLKHLKGYRIKKQ